MDITTSMLTNLLLICNAVLLSVAAIAIIRFRTQARRFEKFWDSPTGVSFADTQSLQAQQPAPVKDVQLEQRVTELQSVVRTLASRTQETGTTDTGKLPTENAVRMARHGASMDELIRNCGLNIGEAQLMRKLHGKTHSKQKDRQDS
jgi:hypothetical protein